jgi:hypothetical protein
MIRFESRAHGSPEVGALRKQSGAAGAGRDHCGYRRAIRHDAHVPSKRNWSCDVRVAGAYDVRMTTFTIVHIVLSLVGIVSGFVVVAGLIAATSATGFGFPFDHLLPSHVVGIISLVVLGVAILGRYGRRLTGAWRATYVLGAVVGLYLNVFVLIVQAFRRVPALVAMAPTQSEPPFVVSQLVVMVLFVVLAIAAVRGFHDQA